MLPEARVALIEFLQARTLKSPVAITSAKHKATETNGFVQPGFEEGSVLLKNEHGEFFRLEWPRTAANQDHTEFATERPIAPGRYTIVNYRMVKQADDGSEWFTSSIANDIRTFELIAGQTVHLDLKPEIAMEVAAVFADGGIQIGAAIMGDGGGGLTIYRAGKRIPLDFVVVDAEGRELASGAMEYG